ncbi:MAG TPA: PEGA domain-containing protein [Candidatus Nanoarchaeia archaeon]|nr:PEGA domain-containing protein [Candidatus Nanoarchaeia archaeon]
MDKKKILVGISYFILIFGLFLLVSYLQMLYTGEAVIYTHEPYGKLKVISNPTLADIYIDGQLKGKSTTTIENIDPGWHVLEVKKEGYANYYTHVNTRVGSNFKVTAKLQKLWPSDLYITSEPIGANIYLDGEYIGTTGNNPLLINNIMPGKHSFKVTKPGYKTGYQDISLVSKKVNAFNFVLKSNTE